MWPFNKEHTPIKPKENPPKYRIRETRRPYLNKGVESRFLVEMWIDETQKYFSLNTGCLTLYDAEAILIDRIKRDKELARPTLCHEYMADGTPIPPAPNLKVS